MKKLSGGNTSDYENVMKLRLGTRGSQLALAQTTLLVKALATHHPELSVEIVQIKTVGDRKQGTAQASQSDKKDWVYDLELALLNKQIDFAVHSGKDCPKDSEPGTVLSSALEREVPYDAFIGRFHPASGRRLSFANLAPNAKVGTASLRRRGQLLRLFPKLTVEEHRGNVPTRIRKLDESPDLQGIILACAGLRRLSIPEDTFEPLSASQMLPALNQGTLAVQFREDDTETREALAALIHQETQATWLAERAVAEVLEGDCKSAIGIFAEVSSHTLSLSAEVLSPDGREHIAAHKQGSPEEARSVGQALGEELLSRGAKAILDAAGSLR